jgi:acetyl esterase/lipase
MSTIHAQTVINLYTGAIPNAVPCTKHDSSTYNANGKLVVSHITVPTLTAFIPEQKDVTKPAVIICPGGGYVRLAIDHEGYEVAKTLNAAGITAFVLKYRLPIDFECEQEREIVSLQDAQQALKIVREKAKESDINPNNIGIVGFSAGGHLASTAGTHFNKNYIPNAESTNLRPDFMILAYPVISLTDSLAHIGSRESLLGKNASTDKIDEYSNELHVTSKTPPTFLVHAADDKSVKVGNSLAFFTALQEHHVPSEMHIYQKGGHGFGLNNSTTKDKWIYRAIHWMMSNNLMKGDVLYDNGMVYRIHPASHAVKAS